MIHALRTRLARRRQLADAQRDHRFAEPRVQLEMAGAYRHQLR